MLEGFITVAEASKKYNRHMTSIRRKIKTREWVETRKRKVNVLAFCTSEIRLGNPVINNETSYSSPN